MQDNKDMDAINQFLQKISKHVIDFSRIPQFQPALAPIMYMLDELYVSLDDTYKYDDPNQLNIDEI